MKTSVCPIRVVDEQVYLISTVNDAYHQGDSNYDIIKHVVERVELNGRHISLRPFTFLFTHLVDIVKVDHREEDENHRDNDVFNGVTYRNTQAVKQHTYCH
jgi:hypothetical protein